MGRKYRCHFDLNSIIAITLCLCEKPSLICCDNMKAAIEWIPFSFGYHLVSCLLVLGADHLVDSAAATSAAGSTSSTDFCIQWVTYKDPNSGKCVPCSPCPENYMTVVLCEFDRDTLCRPSSDLGHHIESVVHSSVAVDEKNVVVDIVLDEVDQDSSISVLVISLSALVTIFILTVSLLTLRRWKKQRASSGTHFEDSMKQSLLEEDSPEAESDKPTLDLDELLAHRYGRSLITNNYVP